jgi:protein-disulfide isomerase
MPARLENGTVSHMTRKRLYLVAIAAGGVLAAVLIALSIALTLTRGGGTQATPKAPTASVVGAEATRSLFAGIPQHGTVLGSADAPVTLVEYADPQCPYCADWALNALPSIVDQYVRPGRVKVEFRGIAFIGPESKTGLTAALAAGQQGKLSQLIDLLYANQGPENGGWITDRFLSSIAGPGGIDWGRFDVDMQSAALRQEADAATARAQQDGITATPAFFAGRSGETLAPVHVSTLDAGSITPTLDRLLAE